MKVLAQVLVVGIFAYVAVGAPKQETPFDKMGHVPSFSLTSSDLKYSQKKPEQVLKEEETDLIFCEENSYFSL